MQYRRITDFAVQRPVHLPNYFTDRAAANFAAVSAQYLRIRFRHAIGPVPIDLQEVSVSGSKRIEGFASKAGYLAAEFPYNTQASTDAESAAPASSVIDLTSKMTQDGILTWSVPKGSWTIVRVASTITGSKGAASQLETRGLDVDKFSREAMDHYWDQGVMKRILETANTPAGKTLFASHIDSWEVGEQNWTPKMREEFTRRRGYDPLPFFPILSGRLVDSEAVTERFLWDYRLTIADLFSDNYFGYFADLCKKNGIEFSNEPYGSGANFDYITSGSHSDLPMGEFGAWIDSTSSGDMTGPVKMATSIGHTYDRPIVQCESFTSSMPNSGFLGHPYRIKSMGDYQYTLGCNRTVLHVYSMQPFLNPSLAPGMTLAQWGTQFGRTVTWWDMAGPWINYLTRTCSMLQQGRFCADVCVFQGQEDVPNTGILSRRTITPPLPSGYDYDVCDSPTLLNRIQVQDGNLVLPGGMSYRFLVLQKSRAMTPAMLQKVGELISAGATVIGEKPAFSLGLKDYPNSDAEVRKLADEIWGDCDGVTSKEHAYGKGRVIWGKSFEQIFSQASLAPDFAYRSDDPKACVNFTHRHAGNADIYFLANWNRNLCKATCSFRVSGLEPEIWNPETGQIEKCPVYKQTGLQTEVPIRFDPSGSLFVVFRHPSANHYTALDEKPAPNSGEGSESTNAGAITIVKAEYGIPNDPPHLTDVTQLLESKLKDNQLAVRVGVDTGKDPAPNESKTLEVDYLLDGQRKTVTMADFGELVLPEQDSAIVPLPAAEVRDAPQGPELIAYKPGQYTLTGDGGTVQKVNVLQLPGVIDCDDHWTVRFQSGRGAPEKVMLDKLSSLSKHPDPGVKYFSGTATYSRTVNIPADRIRNDCALTLDLGDVEVMAHVYLNQHDLGILWKPPFRMNISGFAKAGDNDLEVQVADLWVNRLIGDEQLPADENFAPGGYNYLTAIPDWLANGTPRTSGRITFSVYQFWKKNEPLVASGLIGPVKIIPASVIPLNTHGDATDSGTTR